MTTPYFDRLEACRRERGSALCVGIDPRIDRIPASLRGPDVRTTLERFGTAVHERTRPHAACWKPQIAFFEAHGLPGLTAFVHIVQTIRSSGGLVIADAKRGDIGSTAKAYARAAFGVLGADAITASPYLGGDSLAPFLADPTRGADRPPAISRAPERSASARARCSAANPRRTCARNASHPATRGARAGSRSRSDRNTAAHDRSRR